MLAYRKEATILKRTANDCQLSYDVRCTRAGALVRVPLMAKANLRGTLNNETMFSQWGFLCSSGTTQRFNMKRED